VEIDDGQWMMDVAGQETPALIPRPSSVLPFLPARADVSVTSGRKTVTRMARWSAEHAKLPRSIIGTMIAKALVGSRSVLRQGAVKCWGSQTGKAKGHCNHAVPFRLYTPASRRDVTPRWWLLSAGPLAAHEHRHPSVGFGNHPDYHVIRQHRMVRRCEADDAHRYQLRRR
jgi:hypothetical protein